MADADDQTDQFLWRQLSEMNTALERWYDKNAVLDALQSQRDSTRALLNSRVRSKLRPLHLLDLPDELLTLIFEYANEAESVHYQFLYDSCRGNSGAIRNIRLTCRRFYQTSSHLLLSDVDVEMTPSSLANLDLVSRHPSISRGVRIIRLFLGPFYTSSLAHGIQDFAVHHIAKLNESINRWENEIQWQTPDDPTEPYEKAISEAEHFIESWEQMAADDINENNADHLMLLQAHRKYLELYEDYRKLSCSLPQAITSAMLRMPAAKLISINKENIWGVLGAVGILRPRDFDQPESLLNYLVSPMSWYEAREHDIGPPPFHLIGELLFSIQQLGIPLAGLNIATPPPVPSPSTTNTAATMRELTVLRDVVKRLKIFTFYPRPNIWDEFWTRRPPDEWAHLTSLLRVLLHTSSLERIHLSFYFMGTDKLPPLLSMGSLLLSNTWPNLKDLCFSGPFHFEELKAVVKPLDRSVRLEWSGYLMSGSWADVLEFLQGRNAHEQVLGDVNGSIYGQECLNMNEAEKQFIFHYKMSDIPGMSMATQYIQGFLPSNPVVAWERGELDVPDLTDEDSDE